MNTRAVTHGQTAGAVAVTPGSLGCSSPTAAGGDVPLGPDQVRMLHEAHVILHHPRDHKVSTLLAACETIRDWSVDEAMRSRAGLVRDVLEARG